MARDITVTFADGTSHVYKGAPDDVTPEAVQARAEKEFGLQVAGLDGGRGQKDNSRTGGEMASDLWQSLRSGIGGLASAAGTALDDPLAAAGSAATATADAVLTGPVRAASQLKKWATGDGSLPLNMDQGARDIHDALFSSAYQKYGSDLAKARAQADAEGSTSSVMRGVGDLIKEQAQEAKSKGAKANAENYDKTEGFGAVKYLLSNPEYLPDMVAENLPQQLPMLATGRVFGSLAQRASGAAAAEAYQASVNASMTLPVVRDAIAAGDAKMKEWVVAQATTAAKEAGQASMAKAMPYLTAAGMGSEAATTAAQTADTIFSEVQKAKESDLLNVPEYKAMIDSGKDPEAARLELAGRLSAEWAPVAGMGTIAGSVLTGGAKAEAEALAGQVFGFKQAAKNTGKEMLEEMAQNPLEDAAQYGAQSQYDPNAKMDPIKSAAEGALVSLGHSGPVQVAKPIYDSVVRSTPSQNGDEPPSAPVAPKVEDQPTVPVAPKVEDQPTVPVAPTVTRAPQVDADPIAPINDAALLGAVPVEGGEQVQQPAQSAAAVDEGAGVSQPTPVAPVQEPTVATESTTPGIQLPQVTTAGQTPTVKFDESVAPKAPQQETATANAVQAQEPAATQRKDVVPQPTQANDIIKTAIATAKSHADLADETMYTPEVLQRIADNPQAGPELKAAVARETARRAQVEQAKQDKIEAGRGEPMTVRDEPTLRPLSVERGLELAHTSRTRALLPQEQGYLTALKSEIGDNAFDLVMRSGAQPFRVNATERKFDLPRLVQSNQAQIAQWDQANNPEALAQPKFTPAPQSAQKTQTPAPAYQAWIPLPTMSLPARNLQANMGARNGSTGTTSPAVGTRQDQTGQSPVETVAGAQSANVTQTQYGGPGQPGGAFALSGTQPAETTATPRRQPLKLAKSAPIAAITDFKRTIDYHFGTDVTPRTGPLTDREQAASALLALQGKTLTFLTDKNGNNKPFADGLISTLSGQHVAINGDRTEESPFIVAFHEGALHGLPPDLRNKWNEAVWQQLLDAGEVTAASDDFQKKFKYQDGEVHEELPTFIGQNLAKNRTFWEGVRTKLGDGDFKALVSHILKSLRAYVSGVHDAYGSAFVNKYLHDVPALETLLQDLVVEHHNRVNQARAHSQPGEKGAFALKSSEDGEEADDSRAEITQKDIPESVDAPATLESALKLAGSRVWNKGRDLKVAMQNAVQEAAKAAGVDVGAPSEATTKYLTRVGVKDALGALKQNANAVGWYDLKTRQALSVMALVHPELARDENARFAMVWAMAVTSNGLKVDKNFEIAEKVYQAYKETGEMPTRMGIGQAAGAINDSLKLFNELKAKWGIDNLRQFMLTNFTVKEITGIAKELKPGGEHADVVVRGAAILGPKIGNGFFSNLYGNFDALTMDRWLIRTWGRWTGTLISPMEKQTAKAKDRLAANLAEITKDPAEAARLGEAIGLDIRSDTPLDTLATAVQKASMDPATRKEMNATAVGEELRKAGNGLAKYLDGQKEAPAGPTERKYIRKVFGEILSQLHQDPAYKDLSMADLQAVLWYAEKRLYESSKDDPSEDEVEGYADNEAPDYAVAASDVARKAGVTERRIQNALEKEKQNGRTTDARRADGSPQTDRFGLKVSTGGFTEQERKSFVEWQALKRIGDRRLGGKELSWAYEGESAGNGGRVRRLTDLGVTYVAEWKLGKKAKTVFKANGLTAISMFELAPGDATNAAKFSEAITASKNGTPFGAAVYVYPTKSSEDETGYADMRLFLSKDGKNGVAVKRDGDIVSVFAEQRSGNSLSLLQVALAAGGRKLDAFDTVLPRIYSRHGFRVVARTEWNDDFAPEGWDKELFKEFNGGEPDVVFMAYDPAHGEMYETSDGKTYDDYDKAVAAQKRAVNKVAKDVPSSGPFFARKSEPDLDQDIVLEIPVEGGGTAKLTVNAKTYLEQLDRRQEALEMVKECML